MKMIPRDISPLIVSVATGLMFFSIGNAYSAVVKPSPHEIIKVLAGQAGQTICNPTVNSLLIKGATNNVNIGNYSNAASGYLDAAQGLSVCVAQNEATQNGEGNSIGMLLAFTSELSSKSNSVIPETYFLAKYAKILLTDYPSKSGFIQIKKLEKAGFFGPPKAPSISRTSVVSISAVKMVSQYNGNSFSFNHMYNDKTFKVHGVLSQITPGHHGGALIDLVGTPLKNINNRTFSDYVYCQIPKKNISGIMSIKTGSSIDIEGVYDYKFLHKLYGKYPLLPIELISCKVVQ